MVIPLPCASLNEACPDRYCEFWGLPPRVNVTPSQEDKTPGDAPNLLGYWNVAHSSIDGTAVLFPNLRFSKLGILQT